LNSVSRSLVLCESGAIGEQIIRYLKERQSPWRAVAVAKPASPPHLMGRELETPFIDLDWQAERLPYSPE